MLDKDYIVVEAINGEEAEDIAKRQNPDLILMDLVMPKMDGYTACSRIKANQATKGIPVVMLTGVGSWQAGTSLSIACFSYLTYNQLHHNNIIPLL